MNYLLLAFGLLVLLPDAGAQVTGKLVTADGAPVPFANVLLLRDPDTTLVSAVLTGENGVYRIADVSPGAYRLRFSSIGYENSETPVFLWRASQTDTTLGDLVLLRNTQQLGEVVVRAEKPLFQQQVFGTVINVENSVLTKGSSALELLERSPGVYIDRRTNGIALNGKSGVTVMLNGKLLRMSADQLMIFLQGMTANDIEKIELLSTPPAKYEAAGNAGMINIVIKRNRDPGNFSFTGGYGYGEKAAASVNLGRTIGNTSLYGNYAFSHDRAYYDWSSVATDKGPLFGGPTWSYFRSLITPVQNSHNISIGADTRLTPRTTIGGNISFNHSQVAEHVENYGEFYVATGKVYIQEATIKGSNRWSNAGVSFYVDKKIREGEQLRIDLDYLYYKNGRPSSAYSTFQDREGHTPGTNDTLFSPLQQSVSNTTIQVGVLKMDYSRQLSPEIKIEGGVKGTYTNTGSASRIESLLDGVWVSSPAAASNMLLKESIGAIYSSLEARLRPSLQLVAGVRYEYSRTQMTDPGNKQLLTDRPLSAFFPGIFLSWKVNAVSEWQLSYTKRISRPAYNDLASFVLYTGPTSVETGNPMLKPTITNNLKLGYQYRGYALSLLFSKDKYPMARYQITPNANGNVLVVSPQNLLFQDNVSLQLLLPWKATEWWEMSLGLTGGWRRFKLDYLAEPVQKDYVAYNANFSTTFQLPARFALELSAWYNSSSYDGSKKVDPFGAANGGVRKTLNKNGGSLQLTVTDIFRTMRINSYFGTLAEEAFDLKSKVTFHSESGKAQIIKLTWTKSFGSSQQRQQRAEPEERNRVRK